MKRIFTTLLVMAALLIMASGALAASNCTNATVKGTYAFITNATSFSLVGFATFDGAGNWSSTYTSSVNGTIYLDQQLVGTYTVNSDCTATLTDTTDDLHYWAVIPNHGEDVFAIQTDAGSTLSVDLKRQK